MDFPTFTFNYQGNETRDFKFLFLGDAHQDASNFDKLAWKQDMDWALENDAAIFEAGDFFDAILRLDKRFVADNASFVNYNAPTFQIIQQAVTLLKPYINNIYYMSYGNHEASTVKYSHVDLLQLLVHELNRIRNPELPPIVRGGYTSYITLRFVCRKSSHMAVIYRTHGKGGGAAVTKGMVDFARIHAKIQADIYWVAHKHTAITAQPMCIEIAKASGKIRSFKKISFVTGCYQLPYQITNYDDINTPYKSIYGEEKFYGPQDQGCIKLSIKPSKRKPLEIKYHMS